MTSLSLPGPRLSRRRALAVLATVPLTLGLAACGSDDAADAAASGGVADEVRLGYFANVTHAAALIGVQQDLFTAELGDTTLTTQVFNAGPDEVEALFAGGLDAAYIGPSPTINAYGQSDGDAIRIISGAASGGASLVVQPGITSPADLEGTTLASPQLGNTQDVALRTWLTDQGLENSVDGGGDVTITPTKNSDIVNLFRSGDLDGAWVPEPFASQLVLDAGGKVLVDERDLWPEGLFVTTHLIVRTEFLQQYPETVAALLRGNVAAVELAGSDPVAAKAAVNAGLEAAGGSPLDAPVLDRAWEQLSVTYDPVASALELSAEHAVTAGTAEEQVDLDGIYDLGPLNTVLTEQGLPTVTAGGLGKE
ncbi:aliphatic sulfonate ABC transporter substrate-binding protein [Modestobacter sp. I12A-02628]|uniref:ABC transporter substrate-binding protein n=1 Tax=Goekera deserti TaxID=2497753 RepID=A0A7K3WJX1_9ACTN|nr:ABC transporter substrate-binding protein [Goekera deserti]MPQ99993.1 aliphatic sulfonate ABC transporter substrate-binding protein [Goekera deserti]NDI49772.1 aliphatic sulfonate ABC transporter substrate-binding protein [Goekera deserti]NEL56622.1 ABC transporter substrate-binding protein [Goekera deserti]